MSKDSFADLDSDFKTDVANMSEEQIRKKISEIALNQFALKQAQKEDGDLADAKAQAKSLNAPYAEGTKENNLRIAFCKRALEDMGKDAGTYE